MIIRCMKLLLSANKKSVSIGKTTCDLEWPFHSHRALSLL